MSSTPHDARRAFRLLLFGWSMLAAAALILVVRYGQLPDPVMLYRPPWADTPILGPKTPLTVGRLAAMGLGQVGAATVMAGASWRADAWRRFWTWAVVAAGAKTLLECGASSSPLDGLALALTWMVVGAFVVAALVWWQRGELARAPALGRRATAGVGVFVALWAASAAVPLLV